MNNAPLEKIKELWNKGNAEKIILIVIGILFLPLTLLIIASILYYKYDTPAKRWPVIALFLLIAFPLTASWYSSIRSGFSKSANQARVIDSEAGKTRETGQATASPTSTPAPTEKPKTVKERLEEIAKQKFENDKDLKTEYDEESGLFSTAYGGQSTFWDEAKIVEGMFSSLVIIGGEVFQVEGVNRLKISVENPLTDSYGKESIETVASITMSKDEYEKYDWDNLRFQPIYYQMQQSAEELFIHPALLKKIELGKLKLYYTK